MEPLSSFLAGIPKAIPQLFVQRDGAQTYVSELSPEVAGGNIYNSIEGGLADIIAWWAVEDFGRITLGQRYSVKCCI